MGDTLRDSYHYHNNDDSDHVFIERDKIIINKEYRTGYSDWSCETILDIEVDRRASEILAKIVEKANKYDEIKRLLK